MEVSGRLHTAVALPPTKELPVLIGQEGGPKKYVNIQKRAAVWFWDLKHSPQAGTNTMEDYYELWTFFQVVTSGMLTWHKRNSEHVTGNDS